LSNDRTDFTGDSWHASITDDKKTIKIDKYGKSPQITQIITN